MNNRRLNERVRKLEKQMDASEFEFGSTKIAWECLTRRERLVFSKIMEIQKEYGDELSADILAENMDLFDMGIKIMLKRCMDFFQTMIDSLFLREDKLSSWIFWGRFHAFINTSLEIVKMRRLEDEFYKKFKEEYGEDWIDVLQEKYGDDWPEPDYSSIGERDFDKELKSLIARAPASSSRRRAPSPRRCRTQPRSSFRTSRNTADGSDSGCRNAGTS